MLTLTRMELDAVLAAVWQDHDSLAAWIRLARPLGLRGSPLDVLAVAREVHIKRLADQAPAFELERSEKGGRAPKKR